ncbi:MAG: D-aminoacylase, partial [Flavisolibacter sp.]|nr:D-aminoacylase [Flavisolibacter sp.]
MRIFYSFILFISSCAVLPKENYDVIISGGLVYDGNGGQPTRTDIGIKNDTIAFIGNLSKATAKENIDANG